MASANFYLDTRRKRFDGTSQLHLNINYASKNRLIPLGIYIHPDHWDPRKKWLRDDHPLFARLDLRLRRTQLTVDEALLSMGNSATLAQVCSVVREALFPEQAEMRRRKMEHRTLLVEVADRFAATKMELNTRLTYERTIRHLERFRPSARLDDVNQVWLAEFDAHMSRTMPSANSRAMMMRNLRAVFNFALDEELTTNYPFRRFRIRTVKTIKRNLSATQLRRLFTMEVEDWQRPYRDFFMLSFLLIGINAKDLLCLPGGADREGRVEFNRAKTKRLYSIKVEPEALAIINRYRGTAHLLDFLDTRTDYAQYVRQCNHALKLIGTRSRQGLKPVGEPLFPTLTTYYARHSWATVAASLDIPKETIAAGLGHGGNSVTDIYIDFDRRKVDDANRRVIDHVLYGAK